MNQEKLNEERKKIIREQAADMLNNFLQLTPEQEKLDMKGGKYVLLPRGGGG